MKRIFVILFLLISTGLMAQAERVYQTDSVKSGRAAVSFLVNSRHNYNTVMLKSLISSDSVKIYAVNETNDTTAVALRNLQTWSDLSSNLITGLTGNYEFLVLNPNIYRLVVKYVKATISKTIPIRRRGNNLK
ncbi:MAG: hypothetical protein JNJ56_11305 [Ignavibacteria bacterium]|nr:hypothetical protein [Ignavibacteria bacterium]